MTFIAQFWALSKTFQFRFSYFILSNSMQSNLRVKKNLHSLWIMNKSFQFYVIQMRTEARLPIPVYSCVFCSALVFEVIKLFSGTNIITYKPDHLRIATTCQQQPPFLGPIFNFYNTKLPLNNNHLSTTAPFLGFNGGQSTQVWLYFKKSTNCKKRMRKKNRKWQLTFTSMI